MAAMVFTSLMLLMMRVRRRRLSQCLQLLFSEWSVNLPLQQYQENHHSDEINLLLSWPRTEENNIFRSRFSAQPAVDH